MSLEKEIQDKIDVGFKEKPSVAGVMKCSTSSDDTLRVEALKIAFDFAKHTTPTNEWNKLNHGEQMIAMDQIFELAEINFRFIKKIK